MDSAERSKREAYLDATFPPPLAWEGHAPGPFTDRVVEFLSSPMPIDLALHGRRHVVVDTVEQNGNPLREVIRFRFRLMSGAGPWRPPTLGGVDDPIEGSTEAVHYFCFASDSSLQENVSDFLTFLSEHLGESVSSPLCTLEQEIDLIGLRPTRLTQAMSLAGLLCALIALAIVVPRARFATAIVSIALVIVGGLYWLYPIVLSRRTRSDPTERIAERDTPGRPKATDSRNEDVPGRETILSPRR